MYEISGQEELNERERALLREMVAERTAQQEEDARRAAFRNEPLRPTLSDVIEQLGGRPKGVFCWLRFRRHVYKDFYSGTRGYGHGYKLCKACGHEVKSMYIGDARPLIPG